MSSRFTVDGQKGGRPRGRISDRYREERWQKKRNRDETVCEQREHEQFGYFGIRLRRVVGMLFGVRWIVFFVKEARRDRSETFEKCA